MSVRSDVDARRLDQVITLQRKIETQDSTGHFVVTWQTLVDTRAAVDAAAVTAAERQAADGIRQALRYTFVIRADVFARFGLRLVDRILWRGQPYNIAAAPDNQLGGRLVAITASTGLNQG